MHHAACFRERANLQLVNRRLERKVKEMVMQGEEEHRSMQDQKDQVCNQTLSCADLSFNLKPSIKLIVCQLVTKCMHFSVFVKPFITPCVLILLEVESASEGLETADG